MSTSTVNECRVCALDAADCFNRVYGEGAEKREDSGLSWGREGPGGGVWRHDGMRRLLRINDDVSRCHVTAHTTRV